MRWCGWLLRWRNRTAPAHVVVQRLTGGSPADRLAKALTALGRVVKTIYILRYLHEEEVRRRVQLQLNRGESRHALARWLFFANQGDRHRGSFVVIDDVDSLYADKAGIRLLKCLCQTEEEKSVAWHTDARSLEKHGVPREFTTRSRVIIICNDWRTLNQNVDALQDRGHVLVFQPSAAEVHAQAGQWFDDREIYEWFGKNLHRMRDPSFRHYVRARELKAAGMEWTEVLEIEEENERARIAAEILSSAAYQSTGEKVRAFVQRGGGCRATYFNHVRRLGNRPGEG